MHTKQIRRGSVVPCENVDPHKGSYQSWGIVVGYEDINGKACSRKNAKTVLIEQTGYFVANWGLWAEEHAYKIQPFLDDDVDSPENIAARLNLVPRKDQNESYRKVS